jgi:hypothetical protein
MKIKTKKDGWRLYINDDPIPFDLRTMTEDAAIKAYVDNGGEFESEYDEGMMSLLY